MIGFFVNVINYRLKIDSQLTFKELLLEMQKVCLSVLNYSYLPFQNIVKLLYGKRGLTQGQMPFHPLIFIYQNNVMNINRISFADAVCERIDEGFHHITKFDLAAFVSHNISDGGKTHNIVCVWDYAVDLFNEATANKIVEQFQTLLKHLFSTTTEFKLTETPLYKLSL
ncbi:unnamed protein product [Didymodactylos carnosus]|uniref:Condensation domain-containing protein n=2 Tax=Didymodactylos carnosus TaxID=1234261 RepID=A0A815NHZ2_9BILA|nr:unnamed protein product [Didymodactylos carnosus]CAF4315146.1 unnamed protein product [Didymodactylos carnosus]